LGVTRERVRQREMTARRWLLHPQNKPRADEFLRRYPHMRSVIFKTPPPQL
jgi:hypothetical protein